MFECLQKRMKFFQFLTHFFCHYIKNYRFGKLFRSRIKELEHFNKILYRCQRRMKSARLEFGNWGFFSPFENKIFLLLIYKGECYHVPLFDFLEIFVTKTLKVKVSLDIKDQNMSEEAIHIPWIQIPFEYQSSEDIKIHSQHLLFISTHY